MGSGGEDLVALPPLPLADLDTTRDELWSLRMAVDLALRVLDRRHIYGDRECRLAVRQALTATEVLRRCPALPG